MDPAEQLVVRCSRVGFTEVIAISGELDAFTAPLLAEAVSEAMDANVGKIVIDASDLTFIDGAGVDVLVLAWRAMDGRATMPVVVRSLRPNVHRVLELCGVTGLLIE